MSEMPLENPTEGLEGSDSATEYPDIGVDSGSELDLQVEEASERLSSIPEIQPENWGQLDEVQRLETLQNVENQMAEVQGRPALGIENSDLGSNVFGQYDGDKIQINNEILANNDTSVNEIVDTIVHEGRHAYQDYAVNNPGFDSNTELVNQWAENFEPGNYLTSEEFGYEMYQNQPVEADAWSYASRITSAIYPNEIQNGA